jgi:transcriptional regulator with XRE-family HTH domain
MSERNLPAGARRGARRGRAGVRGAPPRRLAAIQDSKSSGATRSRDRSFTTGSSPSSIARRTAFSESWQASATSRIESRCQVPVGFAAPGGVALRDAAPPVQVIRDALIASTNIVAHTLPAISALHWPQMRPDAVKSANLLREARLRAGLTQEALAQRAGTNRPQIARWEAGGMAPSLETLLDLIHACGFDLPLELVPLEPVEDERLKLLQQLSPERRLEQLLDRLSPGGR